MQNTHEEYMAQALKEARKAYKKNEVPVGAVIVRNNKVLARAHNLRETKQSATAHAEVLAIQKACKKLKSWRLVDCDIYVTVEPCPMCAGALVNARIAHIYYGAPSDKGGSCGTLYNIPKDARFNHNCGITGGVLGEECSRLMSDYFKSKRSQSQ